MKHLASRKFSVSFVSLGLALALTACTGGTDSAESSASSGAPGTTVDHTAAGIGSKSFIVDSNFGGQATNLRIQGVFWGRLVNVFDANDELQHVDFVIGEDIITDAVDYEVTTNPVTEVTSLKILHDAGTAAYAQALARTDDNLIPIQKKGLGPNVLPPFSLAPRNSAIVIRFDDLLGFYFDEGIDPVLGGDDVWRDFSGGNLINTGGQINSSSVQVRTGNPPIAAFAARVFPDPNHGDTADFDGDGIPEFFPTRIIIDNTVSEVEAASVLPAILSPNSLGLPAALTTQLPNVAIRIPTRAAGSVTTPLRNPSAPTHTIAQDPIEIVDFGVATQDVVRAMRSGGNTEVTGDVNNGFLADELAPRLVGSQQVTVTDVCQPFFDQGANCPFDGTEGQDIFRVSLLYALPDCATTPKEGDVLRQAGVFAEVLESPGAPIGGVVANVKVRVIFPLGASLLEIPSLFLSTYDPILDVGREACFVRFSPPAAAPPDAVVSPAAQITVRFTEAMDPTSLLPFDTMTLTRASNAGEPSPFDYVVGDVTSSPDLREFTFVPSVPLQHNAGGTEDYFLRLLPGDDGPSDLAGNGLDDEFPEIRFTLDPNAPSETNGGLVLRFSEASEFDNEPAGADPAREVRGQFLFDIERGRILARPVTRFSAPADRSQPTVSIMGVFNGGVQTPLSPLGSKLQSVWRYVDVGMSIDDETNFNVDVEGLAWQPAAGAALFDFYDEFEMRLSHSRFLPDEVLDAFGFPQFPNSGLQANYTNNLFDTTNDPQRIVHPRERGYVVSPGDLFQAETGTLLMPWPLNREGPVSEYNYYTWRNTALEGVAGPNGNGAVLAIENQVTGQGTPGEPYASGQVRSVGLPLLWEIRCYPRDGAQGLNGFEIALAVNSSSTPNFRAFSTGGQDSSMTPIVKDPDLQTVATGGFNPAANGQTTLPVDNSFYIGQMDLVVRVSRAHTIWFDTSDAPDVALGSPSYLPPVVEPRPQNQPLGTSVSFRYRGATQIVNPDGLVDALTLDAYGDGANPTFFNGANWKPTIAQINGARFFQVRIDFVANSDTGLAPELSALGFAFQQ